MSATNKTMLVATLNMLSDDLEKVELHVKYLRDNMERIRKFIDQNDIRPMRKK